MQITSPLHEDKQLVLLSLVPGDADANVSFVEFSQRAFLMRRSLRLHLTLLLYLFIYLFFLHLADAFIQSDLQ